MKYAPLMLSAACALLASACDFHADPQLATINNGVTAIGPNGNTSVPQLIITPVQIQLLTGQQAQLITNAPFALQPDLVWTSSNEFIAGVSSTGVVAAFTAGTVVISVHYVFDTTNAAASSVTVTVPQPNPTPNGPVPPGTNNPPFTP